MEVEQKATTDEEPTTTLSPLFMSTCKVLRDTVVQDLQKQNQKLRRKLDEIKTCRNNILLYSEVIITEHMDFGNEYKKTRGIYIGNDNCNNGRSNVLVQLGQDQFVIKQIFTEKLIFIKNHMTSNLLSSSS